MNRSLVSASLCVALALPLAAQTGSSTNTTPGSAQAAQRARKLDTLAPPTKDDTLRGPYGEFRANNDLLSYRLDLRVDPTDKFIKGTNTVRFRMLKDATRVQLELTPQLAIDSATMDGKPLKVTRDEREVWIDSPTTLQGGKVYSIALAWSGHPVTQGRFGCFSFDKDKAGKPWITTACEEEGASTWWPNKDQWRDEPQEGMEINVAVPNGLMDVSNGHFVGSKDLGDGYTEWRWKVSYGINNYDVALNIGEYVHWSMPKHGNTALDFYVLPENLEKSKVQFAQVPEMLDAYEHYFGEYPFAKDGYKLVDVPYAGMEHQSAVAYGNHYANGYYERDWTGVGISPKFDFIIIHESGHEWFGNAITAADKCDMWIHEGWTTYLELLYVEYRWGEADMLKYAGGLKPKVHNERPIIPPCGVNAEPPQDQYFKGALMINTLRSMVGDDAKWFADIHDFYQQFKYQQITTDDVVAWWSKRTGMELKPFFAEYLRHAAAPALELKFADGKVSYRYKAEEAKFAMPIKVGDAAHWNVITPVAGEWKSMPWTKSKDAFGVDTDEYYVNVVKE
ncbi:M1 family metallopeptidase [Granulicella cerasi]|uniref:M1 family metallopeptidase n=1 Tax=Granulicella cerasi TaxID=741063 RepID=A0ABW1ZCP5_9BACT|nr:M1 family metallopeptidase [Granulicella cerasi]